MSSHVLITPETCPCDKQSDQSCNVCDGGLAICSVCGKAEIELEGPCLPRSHKYSYSQIQTYAACPLRYFYRYVVQLSPLVESEHDLRFGKAWDAALGVIYSGGRPLNAQEAFAASYPPEEYPANLPHWSPGKSFLAGWNAILAYLDKWQEDNSHWEVLTIQSRDYKEATDEEYGRTVVLDLVVRDRRDGLVYGVDSKTTGKYLDANYASQFEIHSQIRQYVDHLQSQYGQVGGFYIDAASFRHRTKAYTPRKGPDKGVQLPAGDWQDFKRYLYTPNESALLQERQSFANWVRKIEGDRESGTWSYNTDQCVRGPLVCPYHGVCSLGYEWPTDAELILQQGYRLRCPRVCKSGDRCWLEPGHEGECDPSRPELPDTEVDLSEEVEEAVSE